MPSPEFTASLIKYGYELPPETADRIEQYVGLMWTWNEQLNLTRHDTWDKFVSRDLRDCLHLAPLIEPGEDVLDLGSGNGVPGIPLAILRPDVNVSLAESVGKRAKVLDDMVSELSLPIAVYAARGEDLLDDFRFTTIVTRAVGSLLKLCRWVEPHWDSVDRMLAIKGPRWVAERGEARHHGVLNDLQLRVAVSYPLGQAEVRDDAGDDDATAPEPGELIVADDAENTAESQQGVILQVMPKGR